MSPAVVAQTYIGLHAELKVNVDHRYLLPALVCRQSYLSQKNDEHYPAALQITAARTSFT